MRDHQKLSLYILYYIGKHKDPIDIVILIHQRHNENKIKSRCHSKRILGIILKSQDIDFISITFNYLLFTACCSFNRRTTKTIYIYFFFLHIGSYHRAISCKIECLSKQREKRPAQREKMKG